MHIHDYIMEFPEGSTSYILRCKCGDSTKSIFVAMEKTRRTRILHALLSITILSVVAVIVVAVVYAEG